MFSRFFHDPIFDDPFFIPSTARVWGFSDPFEEMRRDPFFRSVLAGQTPMIEHSTPEQPADSKANGKQVAATSAAPGDTKELTSQQNADNWIAAYSRAPAVDIVQRDNEYQINVDVPGVKKEDIKVNLTENRRGQKVLTVSGERKEEVSKEDKDKGYTSRRSMYGKFSRSLALPENSDAKPESIQAKQENGVLKITIPKLKEPPKKPETNIQIQ